MYISKMFILALDGLEYNVVMKLRCRSLLQEVFGYIDVSRFKNLITPAIWTSFITGKEPSEHGVHYWWQFSQYEWFDRLVHWVRFNMPIIKNMPSTKIKRALKVLGLRTPSKRDLKVPTIFDMIKPSVALFVPGYNEETWIHYFYSEAFEKGVKEAERAVWYVHRYRKQKLFEILERRLNWKLFMVWFDLADLIGHLHMGRASLKIMKVYFELARLAARVKEILSDDTLLMIVSDHGMKPGGEHSPRAFYSFSMDPAWRPDKITDYFHFIVHNLRTT